MEKLVIIGGGLAGSEAAWQAAQRGIDVILYEMRPKLSTGAHKSSNLAELVCSNSFGSFLPNRPSGMLITELEKLNSLLITAAKEVKVPAGNALAVDRVLFSKLITDKISAHPRIQLIHEEIRELPDAICVIASGPLTSPSLSNSIQSFTGKDNLFFYDAIAPCIDGKSVDMSIAYRASRYGRGILPKGDYVNCPFTKEQYEMFVHTLVNAERYPLKDFELDISKGVKAGKGKFFEGCLPIEIMASRGLHTLAFGPLRPVGLHNPHTHTKPYAVVQLRQEDIKGRYLGIVGFQTNLLRKEQERVFRLIPGLENASFTRYGQMHKNTYLHSPGLLHPTLQTCLTNNYFFAGQISGVEGYLASIATGWVAGVNASRFIQGKDLLIFPPDTIIGALCHSISEPGATLFQPVKESFGILPPVDKAPSNKNSYRNHLSQREIRTFDKYLNEKGL